MCPRTAQPEVGEKELGHILSDSVPSVVLTAPGDEIPLPVSALESVTVDVHGSGAYAPAEVDEESPALVVYTSGTTGPPKGAVIPRRAVAATLDALADAWEWTGDDVLVQGLPLFHVHGLVLGVLGPLRRGGSVRHLGRFSTAGVARELGAGATMLFGVPTMYHRIAETLPGDPALAEALGRARLLVSGSAALPVHDHERIAAATGRRVVERYGMTETLMNTSVRADGEARPGTVGVPLPGGSCGSSRRTARPSRVTTGRRWARSRSAAEPVHRVPQPSRRHHRGVHRRRLVPHRRHGGP